MKRLDEMFEQMKSGILSVAPGMANFRSEVGQELTHLAKQGAHELATALMGGHDGYVMYPRQGYEQGKDVNGPEQQNLPTKESGNEMEM